MKKIVVLYIICFITVVACSNTNEAIVVNNNTEFNDNDPVGINTNGNENNNDVDTTSTNTLFLKILSLGDSYTIGQSVCETCRFPIQLKDSLADMRTEDISVNIVARTGWTTTNLINAIDSEDNGSNYDLVTLLIGVNNQYQHKPFALFENEFPILIQKAIRFAKNDKTNVVVISIPDYAYTPFGQNSSNPQIISTEIDQYNSYIQTYCLERNISFINVTDITRLGLDQPELVASDGLHPSRLAYKLFVERIIPIALEKLQ